MVESWFNDKIPLALYNSTVEWICRFFIPIINLWLVERLFIVSTNEANFRRANQKCISNLALENRWFRSHETDICGQFSIVANQSIGAPVYVTWTNWLLSCLAAAFFTTGKEVIFFFLLEKITANYTSLTHTQAQKQNGIVLKSKIIFILIQRKAMHWNL